MPIDILLIMLKVPFSFARDIYLALLRKITMPILIIGTALLPDQTMEITRCVFRLSLNESL